MSSRPAPPFPFGELRERLLAESHSEIYCRRSGQMPHECGLSACEYGCDEYEVEMVSVGTALAVLRERGGQEDGLERARELAEVLATTQAMHRPEALREIGREILELVERGGQPPWADVLRRQAGSFPSPEEREGVAAAMRDAAHPSWAGQGENWAMWLRCADAALAEVGKQRGGQPPAEPSELVADIRAWGILCEGYLETAVAEGDRHGADAWKVRIERAQRWVDAVERGGMRVEPTEEAIDAALAVLRSDLGFAYDGPEEHVVAAMRESVADGLRAAYAVDSPASEGLTGEEALGVAEELRDAIAERDSRRWAAALLRLRELRSLAASGEGKGQ